MKALKRLLKKSAVVIIAHVLLIAINYVASVVLVGDEHHLIIVHAFFAVLVINFQMFQLWNPIFDRYYKIIACRKTCMNCKHYLTNPCSGFTLESDVWCSIGEWHGSQVDTSKYSCSDFAS